MSGQAARELIAGASSIVGFTGAGISTESGVPDFRSPNGVWARNRTVDFREFVSSEAGRVEYWRQKAEAWPAMREAKPNAGHHAFVELHRQGRLLALVTQNIERLHQRSGLPADLVLELHGTHHRGRVPDVRRPHHLGRGVPPHRGGRAGAPLPRLRRPAQAGDDLVRPGHAPRRHGAGAGSGGDLRPAHRRRLVAGGRARGVDPPRGEGRRGARLVIVNREPTPLDGIADAVVRGEIGAVLPATGRREGLRGERPTGRRMKYDCEVGRHEQIRDRAVRDRA